MTVDIVNEYEGSVPSELLGDDPSALAENAVREVLETENCAYECQVCITLTGDEGIRKLNSSYRNIDAPTDVLSFPMTEYPKINDTDFDPESGELVLGDIVINMDKVVSQAREYGHSRIREYTFLIVHSMLHLLGYDHVDDNGRVEMEMKQKDILETMGIGR